MRLKSFFLVIFLSVFTHVSFAQLNDIASGAWRSQHEGKEAILLFQDGYFTQTVYTEKEFVFSRGGIYEINDSKVDVIMEYNSQDKEEVGKQYTFDVNIDDGYMTMLDGGNENIMWIRIDNSDALLAGVWQITDRMEGGNIVPIQRSGTRKTLKILTGTRFQWVAMDPATRLFAGTGGGTYSFKDGTYTENIEFFSRDDSRVGAELTFTGKLVEEKWHHSGLSSRGDKIYEVWGRTPY